MRDDVESMLTEKRRKVLCVRFTYNLQRYRIFFPSRVLECWNLMGSPKKSMDALKERQPAKLLIRHFFKSSGADLMRLFNWNCAAFGRYRSTEKGTLCKARIIPMYRLSRPFCGEKGLIPRLLNCVI